MVKKKATPVEVEGTKIYITYDSYTNTIHDDFGQDGPWEGSYERSEDWSLGQVLLSQPKTARYEEFVLAGKRLPKQVYVVYVRYSTGDTFGHTDGCGTIVGCYRTREQAEKIYKAIEDGTYGTSKGKKDWGKDYISTPWIGYFERLEGVHLEVLLV